MNKGVGLPSRLIAGFIPSLVPRLSHAERKGYAGRRVLVTGAGGSIGSALARALLCANVERLVLLDSSEQALHRLGRRLEGRPAARLMLGSILQNKLLTRCCAGERIDLVFHCAALKHVPLLETQVLAAVEHNVLGTAAVLEAARAHGAAMMLLSTDKAVAPAGVMGTTKLLAEQMLLADTRRQGSHAQVLRLCNVLGSSGSVASLFASQIRRRACLTITADEATRFFLTRGDAVRLLLHSGTSTRRGVLLPRSVTSKTIGQLAEYMRCRAGVTDVAVRYTGLHPAEKLHERMTWPAEGPAHPLTGGLAHVPGVCVPSLVETALPALARAVAERDEDRARTVLDQVRRTAAEALGAP